MGTFIVAPEAEDDVFQIWRYLFTEAGLNTANRIESERVEAFANLADTPGRGHRRSDLTNSNVLFYTLYQYMVVYRVATPLEILAVLHGKRDVRRILSDRL
jgi:plasmid stabilization system protein ParE